MINTEKAQASFTYVLMLGGAIVIAVVVWYIVTFLVSQQTDSTLKQIGDVDENILQNASPGGS